MELKECPFCKEDEIELYESVAEVIAYCLHCGARGPLAHDEESAIKAWNRRA